MKTNSITQYEVIETFSVREYNYTKTFLIGASILHVPMLGNIERGWFQSTVFERIPVENMLEYIHCLKEISLGDEPLKNTCSINNTGKLTIIKDGYSN